MANKLARHLRRNMTDGERRLWSAVRRRNISGARFRRQQPIGRYIADFACLETRLVIEVDGGQHAELRRAHDMERDAWLETQNFCVLRFWNRDVFLDLEGVLDVIGEAVRDARLAQRFVGKRDETPLPPCGGAVGEAD